MALLTGPARPGAIYSSQQGDLLEHPPTVPKEQRGTGKQKEEKECQCGWAASLGPIRGTLRKKAIRKCTESDRNERTQSNGDEQASSLPDRRQSFFVPQGLNLASGTTPATFRRQFGPVDAASSSASEALAPQKIAEAVFCAKPIIPIKKVHWAMCQGRRVFG